MARAAVLMAVLCIGLATYVLAGVASEVWRVASQTGLIGAPASSQVRVHRVHPGSAVFARSRVHAS